MRTNIYIDGFNLYYLRLRNQSHFKWLNIDQLAREVLDSRHQIQTVNYYTARVSSRLDAGAPARQQAYLAALATVPTVQVHYGSFLYSEKWAYLVRPPQAKPSTYVWPANLPDLVWVAKTEEKGSDVNLASHLVRDAFTNAFDAAIVISNDTDLVEPIRIARYEAGKTIGLVSPISPTAPVNPRTGRRPVASRSLTNVASFVRYIHNTHLRHAQFAPSVIAPNGQTIIKPASWV
jgi:uncharacterized LabA/DUF88 family protein